MKQNTLYILLALTLITPCPRSYAYVEPVHSEMTGRAFDVLIVDFQRRLGVIRDYTPGNLPLRSWMNRGAYLEDHPLYRPVNHFFDPFNGKGLTVAADVQFPLCNAYGWRADVWAIEPFLTTVNEWSVPRLRDEYARTVIGSNPGERNLALQNLFIGLGHLVHLVQDMAQPEHTRNDQHLWAFQDSEASIWEVWGDRNLQNADTAPVDFLGYPSVRLPDYASYFHTDHTENGRRAGKGMADYSNRNFVTQDTNYHDEAEWNCPGFSNEWPKCARYVEPRIEEAARRVLYDEAEVIMIDGVQTVVAVDKVA